METSHHKTEGEAFIEIFFQLFESVASFVTAVSQNGELLKKFVVVQSEQLVQVILALVRSRAGAEEVGQLTSWSAEAAVLEVNDHYLGWVSSVVP